MNNMKWIDCCKEAITNLNCLGISLAKNSQTIMRWNQDFREDGLFRHPNPLILPGNKSEPLLFNIFPYLKTDAYKYCIEHLDHLTIDIFQSYVNLDLINDLNEILQKNITKDENHHIKKKLKSSNITMSITSEDEINTIKYYANHPISNSTAHNWLKGLAFSFKN